MEHVAKLISARLRQKALGALAVLNREAFVVARTDFAHLLVKDPLKAYEVLLKYSNGNRHKARLILRSVLLGVLGDLSEVDRIIALLEKGDPTEFKKALMRVSRGKT